MNNYMYTLFSEDEFTFGCSTEKLKNDQQAINEFLD